MVRKESLIDYREGIKGEILWDCCVATGDAPESELEEDDGEECDGNESMDRDESGELKDILKKDDNGPEDGNEVKEEVDEENKEEEGQEGNEEEKEGDGDGEEAGEGDGEEEDGEEEEYGEEDEEDNSCIEIYF